MAYVLLKKTICNVKEPCRMKVTNSVLAILLFVTLSPPAVRGAAVDNTGR